MCKVSLMSPRGLESPLGVNCVRVGGTKLVQLMQSAGVHWCLQAFLCIYKGINIIIYII